MSSFTAGTYSAKPREVEKKWVIVDAQDIVLGRLAAEIVKHLRGKHKANYTPHVDAGDNIVVINADRVKVSGRKLEQSLFRWHTGYPGGLKERSQGDILRGKYPERVLRNAVKRMMPKESPLARKQLSSLYIYAGEEHPHAGQKPEAWDFGAQNSKNKR